MTGTNPAPIRTAKQGKPPAFSALKKYFLHKPVFHFLLIFLLGFAVYSNTFHMPFHFDDIHSIVENHKLRDLGSLWLPAGLRWFGYLTFAVNYKLHRLDVVGYHVGNLLIHISNAILVYFLVLFTFRTPALKRAAVGGISGKMTALLAALIFTVHPLQTQAVTYIVQRFASLATLFYLLSLVLYIRWGLGNEGAENGGQYTDKNRRTARVQPVYWYLASFLSAVLGMKTKEVVFTLPIVIGCYDAIFFEHSLRKRIYSLAPFLMTMLIIPFDVFTSRQTFDNLIGDMSDGAPLPRLDYLFTEFAVISTYLRLLVLPVRQNLDYDYPVFHSFMDARVFWSFLLLLVILSAALLLLYRSRTADPRYKMISFGVIWFFITLSVESSVIPIVDVINEHRAYLPSLGFFMAAAVSFFIVMDAVHPRYKHIHSAAIILAITVLIALSGAAYARNTVWKSEVSLWLDVASKSPNKARAFFNLGNAFAFKGRGDLANAGKAWERAMQIDPAFKARVFFNLGNALRDRGDMTSAEKAWERAIESDATFSAAFNQLGVVSYRKKSFETARYYYSRAIQADIENVQAYYNLAMTLEKLRDLDGAAAQYEIFLTKVTPEYYHLIPMVKERLAALAKKR